MHVFKSEFGIGEIVYLKTDLEQLERLITCVNFRPSGVLYTLQQGTNETIHYEIEITNLKDVLKTLV